MHEVAIRTEGLEKKYRLDGKWESYRTLRDTLADAVMTPVRAFQTLTNRNHKPRRGIDVIWALKDVSFEVKRGEVVGVIGSNGAGKSTLLKILSRITEPTGGYADIHGRVGSLLEVGTGFHPELTGRENIYLNGAILGMKKVEIERKFDEMVAFAEVEKFIDTPVKHYSSGMYLRLAFSVAAHLEPEILLVDEVLAVGDMAFQQKCMGKMGDVVQTGRTILFVSHNMGAITRLCQRTLWIDKGGLRMYGPTEQVVSRYLTSGASTDGQRVWDGDETPPGASEFKMRAARIKNTENVVTGVVDVRKPFYVELEYEITERLPYCRIGIIITTVDGIAIFDAYDADKIDYSGPREPGRFISRCAIPGDLLSPGRFAITLNAGVKGIKNLARLENVLLFEVQDMGAVGAHSGQGGRKGLIRPRLEWQKEVLRS